MRKIFIDCGYNQGNVTSDFRNVLGDQFEFYAFEANPYLYEQFKNRNPFCILENKAVWVENTTIPFYVVTVDRHGNRNTNTGASTLVKSKSDWNMSIHKEQEVVDVEAIDFSKFIKDNFDPNDTIIIKMDIEGAEYDVIQNMIDNGVIHYINEMYIEFHDSKVQGFSKESILEQLSKTNVKVNTWF